MENKSHATISVFKFNKLKENNLTLELEDQTWFKKRKVNNFLFSKLKFPHYCYVLCSPGSLHRLPQISPISHSSRLPTPNIYTLGILAPSPPLVGYSSVFHTSSSHYKYCLVPPIPNILHNTTYILNIASFIFNKLCF